MIVPPFIDNSDTLRFCSSPREDVAIGRGRERNSTGTQTDPVVISIARPRASRPPTLPRTFALRPQSAPLYEEEGEDDADVDDEDDDHDNEYNNNNSRPRDIHPSSAHCGCRCHQPSVFFAGRFGGFLLYKSLTMASC